MKKHLIYMFASAALVLAGCSKGGDEPTEGLGRIRLNASADSRIESRAATTPSTDDFALTLTGADFDRTWVSVAAFEAQDLLLKGGAYKAVISYGDPDAEGLDKPYYYGEQSFDVVARHTSTVGITAQIANSQVAVTATEQFCAYFHDIRFTVTSASGNAFDFTPGAATVDQPVYVKAGTALTLTGTAKRQSQTGADFTLPYTFPTQTLDQTVARTCHTFSFDARDAGSATLTVTLGENTSEVIEIPVELNDGAIPDEE